MNDIIQLLPDSVANQIAAGEVIQRPSSVVKELVENAVDANSSDIKINIKDSGRTLIQVIDNGKGMSPTDSRMAFERHATSKIKEANDLFAITTMGFRGEALASIAAVADVELRTKTADDELGTILHITGSKVKKQESESCPQGSNISVRKLFFNVPARRKFLKSHSTEFRHIVVEIQRISLANPDISFSLLNNGTPVYVLPKGNVKQRIVSLFGKKINHSLMPLRTDTTVVKVSGYIGDPKFAKKTFGEQFFFVNGRFIKHPYFHRAIIQTYGKTLPAGLLPSYFVWLNVDPANIDINIHPTKTEIKFEDEQSMWRIISACVQEALGKFNVVPSIEFDQAGAVDIPLPPSTGTTIPEPKIAVNPGYNPFERENKPVDYTAKSSWNKRDPNLNNWEKLYEGFDKQTATTKRDSTDQKNDSDETNSIWQQAPDAQKETSIDRYNFLQVKNRYILTPVKSGVMIIDQRRAHKRILFEHFTKIINSGHNAGQHQLIPQEIEVNASDEIVLSEIMDSLNAVGFELRKAKDGVYYIDAIPSSLNQLNGKELIESTIENFKTCPVDIKEEINEQIAYALAKSSAINYGTHLGMEEIVELFDSLFACHMPSTTPSGKPVLTIISTKDLGKILK